MAAPSQWLAGWTTEEKQATFRPLQFLDLPPEIRLMVYEDLISRHIDNYVLGDQFSLKPWWKWTPAPIDAPFFSTSIMLTCKVIHAESAAFLYSCRPTLIDLYYSTHQPYTFERVESYGHGLIHANSALLLQHAHMLRYIRTLKLDIVVDSFSCIRTHLLISWAQRRRSTRKPLFKALTSLRTAEVVFFLWPRLKHREKDSYEDGRSWFCAAYVGWLLESFAPSVELKWLDSDYELRHSFDAGHALADRLQELNELVDTHAEPT